MIGNVFLPFKPVNNSSRENLQETIEMLFDDSAITAVEDMALAKAIG
jgi:hypothetical protein